MVIIIIILFYLKSISKKLKKNIVKVGSYKTPALEQKLQLSLKMMLINLSGSQFHS